VADAPTIDPVFVPSGESLAANHTRQKHRVSSGACGRDFLIDQLWTCKRNVHDVAEVQRGGCGTVLCDIDPPHEDPEVTDEQANLPGLVDEVDAFCAQAEPGELIDGQQRHQAILSLLRVRYGVDARRSDDLHWLNACATAPGLLVANLEKSCHRGVPRRLPTPHFSVEPRLRRQPSSTTRQNA
jgi:hypothetical protein